MEAAAEMSPILQEKLNDVLSSICGGEVGTVVRVHGDCAAHGLCGAAEQVGKLKFGAVQSVTAFFDDVVLIHINHAPLVITLVAPNSPHIGALHALASELRPALTPLKKCVESADVH
ncbi:Ragulator complex protein LAMTOR3 [Phytophthora cactorum]|nr:Ragulator complex protein LAMTOR3 [Phytophthora cactorum]